MSKECHHCLLKLYCGRRISFGQYVSSHSQKRVQVGCQEWGLPGTAVVFFFCFVVYSLYSLLIGMNLMLWEFVSNQENHKNIQWSTD